MKTKRKPRLTEVAIESFSKKGNGLGSVTFEDGRTCPVEIPFTAPGDYVQASLYSKKGGVIQGRLEEIIEPSSKRVQPKCPHFSVCGGCRWQHISYEEQQQLKVDNVRQAFDSLLPEGLEVMPMIPSDPPWEYRNKMEFTFSDDSFGERYLGLVMTHGKQRVVTLSECHLVNPWFITALEAAKKWWESTELKAYHSYSDTGSLRTLAIREGIRTGDRLIVLTVSGHPEYTISKSLLDSFVEYMREAVEPEGENTKMGIFLRIQQIAKGVSTSFFDMRLFGSDYFRETLRMQVQPEGEVKELHFKVGPTTFFQPNTRQAEKLFSAALKAAKISKDAVVYDLYCGAGTIGICIAPHVKQVVGVEVSSESAANAQMNADLNGLQNYSVISGAVRYVLEHVTKSYPLPDVVVVDPPRAGLDQEAIDKLLEVRPEKILYISCNPTSQARDVSLFLEGNYKLVAIQPVDQFPHTVHIENIVVLEKC